MSRSLSDLDPKLVAKAVVLLDKAESELGFAVVIIDTLRTPEEQAENIRKGVSWTVHSKHLPQPDCGKSHAIDVAPRHLMALKGWAPYHPDWKKLGVLGESLGLVWGGRWRGKKRDCPHFELR